MSDLRSKVIRLAHSRPDLRPALLPLLKESAPRVAGKPHKWINPEPAQLYPEATQLFNRILGEARKVDWESYMIPVAIEILEKTHYYEDIPDNNNRKLGIGGDRLQDIYENKSLPFGAQRGTGTINVLLENPRIKGLIHKYVEAAEKTGVSALDAAAWLDEKAWSIFVNIPNPIIFDELTFDDHDVLRLMVEEIKENDEEYQAESSAEEWAYSRQLDSRDRW